MAQPNWSPVRYVPFADPEAEAQAVASAEQIERQRAMARALQERSAANQDIRHPLQGLAKMADAGLGAFTEVMANRKADERQKALASAIGGMIPEGGFGGVDRETLAKVTALDPEFGAKIASAAMQKAADPPERWEEYKLPDGAYGQRSSKTGKVDILTQAPKPQGPMPVAPGATLYDPGSKQAVFTAPAEVTRPLPDDVEAQKIRLAQAGRAQNNTTINNKGNDEVSKLIAKSWDEAEAASLDAQKRAPLYERMETAMAGFEPGAGAELKAKAAGILKEFGIGEGMPEAEVYKSMQRRLELAATPRGQGQITENERALIRDTIPSMTMTPQAIRDTLSMLRTLDAYDAKVAGIFRDSARQNGGVPDPVAVREAIATLGPALPGDVIQRLQVASDQQSAVPPRGGPPAPDAAQGAPMGGAPPQPPQAGPQDQPAQIMDDAGYDALPSGATFVGPDGKVRRKP